jgi:hypothetical protein
MNRRRQSAGFRAKTIFPLAFACCLGFGSASAAGPEIPIDEDAPTEEPAPVEVLYMGSDALAGTSTAVVIAPDGNSLSILIDRETNTVYAADGAGRSAQIGVPELADAYAAGDATKRAAFMAGMQRNLSAGMSVEIIAKPIGHALLPPNGLASPCDLQPCSVLQPNFLDQSLDSIIRWSVEGIDYSYENFYTPEEIAEDREDFDRWQAQQCEAVGDSFLEALFGYVVATGSCPTASTILTGAVCVGSLGTAIHDHNQGLNAQRNCRMKYPGPGKWGR